MNKSLKINIITTILNVVVVGLVYFWVYKLLFIQVGSEQLGVWSLVLASSSIANLANFGLTSSVVKFVASYNANSRTSEISSLLFTSTILMGCIFLSVALVVYFFSELILNLVVPSKYFELANSLLPISLACLVINAIGGIFTSGLEGFQKNYFKNIIYIIASILFISISIWLMPTLGIMGVAYAQLVQSIIIFFLSFAMLKKLFPQLKIFKWQWDKAVFNEIFKYGVKFQVISFTQLLYDPMTKMLIGMFGGLSMVGIYEMASRLVMQVRGVIINANQVMVPVVADLNEKDKSAISDLYNKMFSIIVLVTIPILSFLISTTDVISYLWLQSVNENFWIITVILSFSMIINIISGPAYFTFLGLGNLNPLLISHVVMGLLNFVIGYILGIYWGGIGPVIGWFIAVIVGSSISIYLFQKNYFENVRNLIRTDTFSLCISAILNVFIVLFIRKYVVSINYTFLFSTLSFIITFLPSLIINKYLRTLFIK